MSSTLGHNSFMWKKKNKKKSIKFHTFYPKSHVIIIIIIHIITIPTIIGMTSVKTVV